MKYLVGAGVFIVLFWAAWSINKDQRNADK
jgi:hypothetical protein